MVARERIADEPWPVRVHAGGRRVVDRDEIAVGVAPLREVAGHHLRRGDGDDRGRRGGLVPVAPRSDAKKNVRLRPLYSHGQHHRTAEHAAEIVLLTSGGFGTAECFAEIVDGVERVVSDELEGFALPPVRARSRDEAHCPAAGVAELRFEAVAVDRELGDGLDRRRIERRPQPLLERRSRASPIRRRRSGPIHLPAHRRSRCCRARRRRCYLPWLRAR